MLTALAIENVRCIQRVRLEFDPRATGIVGCNASGKTSLLESIYFLGHGRSFRAPQREKLLRVDADYFRVVGDVETPSGGVIAGAEYGKESGLRIHLAGRNVSGFSQLAEILPIQVIDPGVHRIIEEGSARRRRLLDWGVFHVKHDFLYIWRRYQRALQQRNAALRRGQVTALVTAWDSELCQCAELLDNARCAYVVGFKAQFRQWTARLLGIPVEIDYHRGWRKDVALADALGQAHTRDVRLKTTSVGPHRADLSFTIDGGLARERISRGQQKMLASAFVLALMESRAHQQGRPTSLLLDDPAAELDVDNLGKLLAAIAEIPSQLIVTSVHERGLQGIGVGRRFHVKQGQFSPML